MLAEQASTYLWPVMLHEVQKHTVVASISTKNCGVELLAQCAMDALNYHIGRQIFDCCGFADDAVAVQHLLELATHELQPIIVYNFLGPRVTTQSCFVDCRCHHE